MTQAQEFIFGTLATLAQRVARVQAAQTGVQHRHQLTPLVPLPDQPTTITVTVALPQTLRQLVCYLSEPETAVVSFHLVRTEWDMLNWGYVQVWQATLPPRPMGTVVRYQIAAYPLGDSDPILADEGAIFSYRVALPDPPAWAAEAVIYQIFPDRFYPGNGRSWRSTTSLNDIYGGTLAGIIDKLDYIADLGFNCLWLNPFLPDHTHHNYHACDYFSVNPRLGTLGEMRRLVQEAHARGVRLLMDFVAGHCGRRHPAFQSAQADRHSPYYPWFKWRRWPDDYETFFDVQDLPRLNVDETAVRDYLLHSACFWLQDIGFDGLRLDYAPGPSHDFWTALRATVEEIRPDIWLFGEVVEAPPQQLSYVGRLHGYLDFVLNQALRATFALGTMDLAAFDAFLAAHSHYFPAYFSQPSFLDNHDMSRFLWSAGGDRRKLKVAALCQFTLPGAPIVYNGTEVGVGQARGVHDPMGQGLAEARQPMGWRAAQDRELHAYFRWLVRFRRQHPVLWNGRRQTVHLDPVQGTYAYLCTNDSEGVAVAFNLNEQPGQMTLSIPDQSSPIIFNLPAWSGDVVVYV